MTKKRYFSKKRMIVIRSKEEIRKRLVDQEKLMNIYQDLGWETLAEKCQLIVAVLRRALEVYQDSGPGALTEKCQLVVSVLRWILGE
jgi:hypothetical protein